MQKSDIKELIFMCDEAIDALTSYEKARGLGISNINVGELFNKITAVGIVCLDGNQINSELKKKIPLRSQPEFQGAILYIRSFQTLNGNTENIGVKSALNLIKSVCQKILSSSQNMSNHLKIFYSWQSNLPNNTNRSFIKDSIQLAVKNLNNDFSIESRISLDSDTVNVSGSPDIVNTILEKIDKSDIFIADVSIVNERMPNPNVMFELGYAIKSLGDKKIIMLFNSAFGSTKDLPFDLGFKRQMIYEVSETDNKSDKRKELSKKILEAIKLITESSITSIME